MLVRIFNNRIYLARSAAEQAATSIRNAIAARGRARIIAATGTSQFQFLDALTEAPGINWKRVEAFHLDEYIGLPITHPASFRKILMERLVTKTGITSFHGIEGNAPDPRVVLRDLGRQLASAPIDVAFVGIGENGHIAFNDPPADFTTPDPYILVNLDGPCRRQQVGEGWFPDISAVPTRAITMSPRQILKAREIVTVVPDQRKAQAVRDCFEGEITPMAPASILRRHSNTTVYLDRDSASLLTKSLQYARIEDSQVRARS